MFVAPILRLPDTSVSCIKPFSFGICQSSWIYKSMANSIMIVFGASEFDEIGEGCSIWTNCDCVSYQKFVVKWPPWQHCNSLLQKCVGQSNDGFTFKFNFLPQKQTNYSKQNNSFFYFACVYEDRNKTINISNWSKK